MLSSVELSSDRDALYRSLVYFSPFPTAVTAGQLHTLRFANPAFCHLAGMTELDLIGQPVSACLTTCPDCMPLLMRVINSGQPELHIQESHAKTWSYAAWPAQRADHEPLTLLQITETSEQHHRATLMNEALLVSAVQQHEEVEVATASAEKMNHTIILQDAELDRTKEELRSLALQLLQAQEDERRRIARELHDSFAQQLASLGMQIFQLQKQIPGETGQDLVANIQTQLGVLASEVRALSHQLHPPSLEDLGLTVSLQGLLADFEAVHSIATRLIASELPGPVPIDIATTLFRIVQESLWNVVKHAGKDALVTVFLTQKLGALILRIEDSGVGFDSEQIRGKGGLGLISIQERARLVGGSAKVEASPGAGTKITVCVPRPA